MEEQDERVFKRLETMVLNDDDVKTTVTTVEKVNDGQTFDVEDLLQPVPEPKDPELKTLEGQLNAFKANAQKIHDKCIVNKYKYPDNKHTLIAEIDDIAITIYFSDGHSTWSVNVGDVGWQDYLQEFEIPIDYANLYKMEYANILLSEALSSIKQIRRKLNFTQS